VPEQKIRSVDDPSTEVLATFGLITMVASVVTGVIAVVALGGGGGVAPAAGLATLAVLSFVVSLVCFAADSNRSEGTPLPFPSWIRTDAEPTAEFSALR
jgi:hypothetical protein